MVNNHLSSCNLYLILEINESINETRSQFLVTPTRQTINPMALKFPHCHFIESLVYQMEGFSNQIKIEGMVSYYLSSCNSEQLQNIKSRTGRHTHTHARLGQKQC